MVWNFEMLLPDSDWENLDIITLTTNELKLLLHEEIIMLGVHFLDHNGVGHLHVELCWVDDRVETPSPMFMSINTSDHAYEFFCRFGGMKGVEIYSKQPSICDSFSSLKTFKKDLKVPSFDTSLKERIEIFQALTQIRIGLKE